jgi:hypothetical protein
MGRHMPPAAVAKGHHPGAGSRRCKKHIFFLDIPSNRQQTLIPTHKRGKEQAQIDGRLRHRRGKGRSKAERAPSPNSAASHTYLPPHQRVWLPRLERGREGGAAAPGTARATAATPRPPSDLRRRRTGRPPLVEGQIPWRNQRIRPWRPCIRPSPAHSRCWPVGAPPPRPIRLAAAATSARVSSDQTRPRSWGERKGEDARVGEGAVEASARRLGPSA